jgi:hypothetical protein
VQARASYGVATTSHVAENLAEEWLGIVESEHTGEMLRDVAIAHLTEHGFSPTAGPASRRLATSRAEECRESRPDSDAIYSFTGPCLASRCQSLDLAETNTMTASIALAETISADSGPYWVTRKPLSRAPSGPEPMKENP